MIVIATKTEIRLREDLNKYLKHKPNQRCFFLELSKTDIPKDGLFETFLRLLEDIPNSYMAKVYLCQDKDILIMMEGFMQRQFLGFVKTLTQELDVPDFTEYVDVFELAIHWDKIQKLYSDKIEAIEDATKLAKETERKTRADQATSDVLSKLNPKDVTSVHDRRQNRKNPVIMIADDDSLSRTLAGNVLRDDFEVVFAQNGRISITEFVRSAPDVIFLDIGMPDIGGHEVLEAIFQIDPAAYIIMFSGRKDKTTIMKSLEMGAQGFVGKPFTREELFNHVQNSPFVQIKQSAAA